MYSYRVSLALSEYNLLLISVEELWEIGLQSLIRVRYGYQFEETGVQFYRVFIKEK